MRLGDIVGQDLAVGVLLRAVSAGRVAHAYLFDGPPGVGKRATALALAEALNCERPDPRAGSCGACEACRRIRAGLHPDVVTVVPDGTQILIEQVREIAALATRGPHEGRARVIVIDDADRMNPNAANGLLKTLEEPVPATHLLLVSAAPDRLLPTIRSRAQRLRFRLLGAQALRDVATAASVDPQRADSFVARAGGSAARLLELAGQDQDVVPETAARLREVARGRGVGPIFDAAAAFGDKDGKSMLPEILGYLAQLYRDEVVRAAGAAELALLDPDSGRPVSAARGACLNRALAAIVETDEALLGNANPTLALEHLLIALRREERRSA